jgi:hypothetical protein
VQITATTAESSLFYCAVPLSAFCQLRVMLLSARIRTIPLGCHYAKGLNFIVP